MSYLADICEQYDAELSSYLLEHMHAQHESEDGRHSSTCRQKTTILTQQSGSII